MVDLANMETVEKECGALGGLFQAIVNDMKVNKSLFFTFHWILGPRLNTCASSLRIITMELVLRFQMPVENVWTHTSTNELMVIVVAFNIKMK